MINNSRYLAGAFHVIAHRGGALEAPENTMAAFDHAAKIYNEMIFEIDVHRTRDGEVVVIHDDTLDRTTNGHGNVHDLNLVEIKKFDAGYHFINDGGHPFRNKNVRVPTLIEVLKTHPQSRMSIEIKRANPHFEDLVVKIVEDAGATDRVCLAGEHHNILSKARSASPRMCSGFSSREILQTLIFNRTGLTFLLPQEGDVYQIPIEHKGIQVFSQKLINVAHKNKKAVHVWTINNQSIMAQLIKEGADGIITDAPSLLLKVARELKKI
ncbi:MAG: glycerophosphodiester phosphodiesterase [Oligoflexia bacterium]|nr:glycerophosphodiester phosphodiesterase [Oligoflexia bacterium]